jgi:predicted  nucleic acid-binding Zn-ribbon protein
MNDNITQLLEEINELVEERDEKQEFFDEATEKGEAEEADSIYETIAEINDSIEAIKQNLIRLISKI